MNEEYIEECTNSWELEYSEGIFELYSYFDMLLVGLSGLKLQITRLTKKMEEELRMIQYLRRKLDRND